MEPVDRQLVKKQYPFRFYEESEMMDGDKFEIIQHSNDKNDLVASRTIVTDKGTIFTVLRIRPWDKSGGPSFMLLADDIFFAGKCDVYPK